MHMWNKTAFPCKGCVECGKKHTDPFYEPDKSTSFKSVSCDQCVGSSGTCEEDKCTQRVAYLEESEWKGYMVSLFLMQESK